MYRNYNTFSKQYRFIKTIDPKENILNADFKNYISKFNFIDRDEIHSLVNIEENLYEYNGDFYIPQQYRPYILHLFVWTLARIVTLEFMANKTVKKIFIGSIIAIIGAVASYAILKFLLEWI